MLMVMMLLTAKISKVRSTVLIINFVDQVMEVIGSRMLPHAISL